MKPDVFAVTDGKHMGCRNDLLSKCLSLTVSDPNTQTQTHTHSSQTNRPWEASWLTCLYSVCLAADMQFCFTVMTCCGLLGTEERQYWDLRRVTSDSECVSITDDLCSWVSNRRILGCAGVRSPLIVFVCLRGFYHYRTVSSAHVCLLRNHPEPSENCRTD